MPISENQSIGMAILATLFAYDGWILLASIGGEMKNPTKLLPKAMTVGILIVTAAYVLINLALLNVLPAAKIVDLEKMQQRQLLVCYLENMVGKLLVSVLSFLFSVV